VTIPGYAVRDALRVAIPTIVTADVQIALVASRLPLAGQDRDLGPRSLLPAVGAPRHYDERRIEHASGRYRLEPRAP
jgi:hypothetical protein